MNFYLSVAEQVTFVRKPQFKLAKIRGVRRSSTYCEYGMKEGKEDVFFQKSVCVCSYLT